MVNEQHSKLIDDLGGTAKVAKLVEDLTGITVKTQNVSNWRRRGIAWPMRGAVAKAAVQRGVGLPPKFLVQKAVR